jgi:hypothetical protein
MAARCAADGAALAEESKLAEEAVKRPIDKRATQTVCRQTVYRLCKSVMSMTPQFPCPCHVSSTTGSYRIEKNFTEAPVREKLFPAIITIY